MSDTLARLTAQLGDRAAAGEDLDVAVRHVETDIGGLLLASTSGGLVRVEFVATPEEVDTTIAELARDIGPRVLTASRPLEAATRQLQEYLLGRRRRLDLAVDLRLTKGYRAQVVQALADIPYGEVATYGQLAARTGHPGAARAVGSACATNPLPLVLPCHRVVRGDGSSGHYRGGAEMKRHLLAMESAG